MKRALMVAGLVAAAAMVGARVEGQQRGKLGSFMRPKMEHSKLVLEGLTLENFSLIEKNAQAMKDLSEAAEWKVSPSVPYLRYSGEFQRLADELVEKAKAKDLDGATLSYVQLTINCVNCHKFVRDSKIISALPEVRPTIGAE